MPMKSKGCGGKKPMPKKPAIVIMIEPIKKKSKPKAKK